MERWRLYTRARFNISYGFWNSSKNRIQLTVVSHRISVKVTQRLLLLLLLVLLLCYSILHCLTTTNQKNKQDWNLTGHKLFCSFMYRECLSSESLWNLNMMED
jgi:hypothetical protein